MSEWTARRFWTEVTVEVVPGGFSVCLDNRPVRTPAKAALWVPTRALAEAIAAEWDAQRGTVNPASMPVTRAANAAIDKVAGQRAELVDMLAAYADSDLTCYRAAEPPELAARQAAAWDPLLDWAAEVFGARLQAVEGVVHVPQPAPALARLRAPVAEMGNFELTGLHDLVGLSGSLLIGLAATKSILPVDDLWLRSRIDEAWQEEQWGRDDEAAATAARKESAFRDAERFFRLSGANA